MSNLLLGCSLSDKERWTLPTFVGSLARDLYRSLVRDVYGLDHR